MNNFIKYFLVIILVFCICVGVQAYSLNDVPATTLQIAKDSGYACVLNSKTVRVGIGNQNFSSYIWNNASIYGTGEFEIYDNMKYVDTYDANNTINVSLNDGKFIIKDSSDKEIARVFGPLRFRTYFGYLGVKGLKRAGHDALYRGEIEVVPSSKNGYFHIVNSLDLEDYLKGVVPNEMPVHFGLEALKAQTVSARNYVLSPRVKANPNYDVVDSVASQVYYGVNTEKELSNRAVEETLGVVATYDWNLILALYSSTAGGYTEDYSNAFSDPKTKQFPAPSKPYLKGKPDYLEFGRLDDEDRAYEFYTSKPKSFDQKSRYYRWEREWTQNELQTEIQNHIAAQSSAGFVHPTVNKGEIIGKILRIEVLERGVSGKIIKLQIQTDKGNYIVEKELVIRRLLTEHGKALPSANVVFDQEFDENGNLERIKAYGGGYGHGVGLSQFGAGYMSTELHYTYEKILQHYYTGISLTTEPFELSSKVNENYQTQNFYADKKRGFLVADNKNKINYINVRINNIDKKIEFDTSIRYNRIDISDYLQKGINTVTFSYPHSWGSLKMYVELTEANEYGN